MRKFFKMRFIESQILVSASIIGLIAILILIVWSTLKIRAISLESSIGASKSINLKISSEFHTEINKPLLLSKTLSDSYTGLKDTSFRNREQLIQMMNSIVKENKNLLGVYTCWEANAFDGKDQQYSAKEYHDQTGRLIPYVVYSNSSIIIEPITGYETENSSSAWYYTPKRNGGLTIIEPFQYPINGKPTWMMSVISPVIVNGVFRGIFGVDLALDSIQGKIKNKTLIEGEGSIYLISENGSIVASSDDKHFNGSTIKEQFSALSQNISTTKEFNSIEFQDTVYTFNPIYFTQKGKPWIVMTALSKSAVMKASTSNFMLMLVAGLFILIGFIGALWIIVRKLITPIKEITNAAQQVALGETKNWNIKSHSVETDLLIDAFEDVVEKREHITQVCRAIANGDLNAEAEISSDKDSLSIAVNQMIANLKTSNLKEEQRGWINQGLAQFSDVLRNFQDLNELGDVIVSKLASFLKLNQVSFFLVVEDDDEVKINLISSYAWNRKKYLEKSILPGEGLVGQCYLEQDKIYLTEVPNDYIRITSGLGESNPSCILIMPLKINNDIEGIIEMASFTPLMDYQLEFIYKITESIASTIKSLRITQKTKRLLEDSRQKTEELQAQEEEMRQNMEEMQATQEELARKEMENKKLMEETMRQAEEIELKSHNLEETRKVEKERTEHQIEAQKKMMEKYMATAKEKELSLVEKIKELELNLTKLN